jgi:hypothetical protein
MSTIEYEKAITEEIEIIVKKPVFVGRSEGLNAVKPEAVHR